VEKKFKKGGEAHIGK
jgi:hypothetical protein